MSSPRLFQKVIATIMSGFFMLKLLMGCIALLLLSTPVSVGLMRLVPCFVSTLYPSGDLGFFYHRHNLPKFLGFYAFLLVDIVCSVLGVNLFDNEIMKCNYRLLDHISANPLSFIAVILSNSIANMIFVWVFGLTKVVSAYIPLASIFSLIAIVIICLGEAPVYHASSGQTFVKGSVYPGQITIVTSSEIQTTNSQPQSASTSPVAIYSAPALKNDVESAPLYNAAFSTLSHAGHDAKI